jgi:hypothetical protein
VPLLVVKSPVSKVVFTHMPEFNYNSKTKQPFSDPAEGGNVASNAGIMYPKDSKKSPNGNQKNMLNNAFKKLAKKSK